MGQAFRQRPQPKHPSGSVRAATVRMSPRSRGLVMDRHPLGQFSTHTLHPAQTAAFTAGLGHSALGTFYTGSPLSFRTAPLGHRRPQAPQPTQT